MEPSIGEEEGIGQGGELRGILWADEAWVRGFRS